jgi:asparagine synthase (glutamine-hydrolysing)
VLRDAFADYLPPEILARRKHGFLVPVRRWLRQGRLHEEIVTLIAEQTLFDPEPLRELLTRHTAGIEDHSVFLWAVYVFMKWQKGVRQWPASQTSIPLTAP